MTAYEDIRALNWSTLRLIGESPKWLRWCADHPRQDTPALRLGRIVHCAVLEPLALAGRYSVRPDVDGRTKAGKELVSLWRASLGDREEVTAEEMATALHCRDAIDARADVRRIIDAQHVREGTLEWTLDGVPCKGRIDAGFGRIVDIKTTRRRSVRDILRDLAEYEYHGQLAWYHDGAIAAGHAPSELPIAIVVQTSPPYDVVVVESVRETHETGQRLYQRYLDEYTGCSAMARWPGMAEHVVPWELPRWRQDETL